jgi:hypothetical protein
MEDLEKERDQTLIGAAIPKAQSPQKVKDIQEQYQVK